MIEKENNYYRLGSLVEVSCDMSFKINFHHGKGTNDDIEGIQIFNV